MSCLLHLAYSEFEQGSVSHAFPVLPSAYGRRVGKENGYRKVKKRIKRHIGRRGATAVIHPPGKNEDTGAPCPPLPFLLQLLAPLLQLLVVLSCSLQELLSFLVLLLEHLPGSREGVSTGQSLLLPHPAPYIAAAASWLRRKSPSVIVEDPSEPHRVDRRCFTSSSFTSISFSTETKSNEHVRAG